MNYRFIVTVFILFITTAGCGILGNEGEPKPEIPGKILFSSSPAVSGDRHIYAMRTNGTKLTRLTYNNDGRSGSPSWSADGSKIVFASDGFGLQAQDNLFTMDVDGGNVQPIGFQNEDLKLGIPGIHPKFSPDGSKIAYEYCYNCHAGGRDHEIFVFDIETQTNVNITNNNVRDRYPEWSPDGSYLVFSSEQANIYEDGRLTNDLYSYTFADSSFRFLSGAGFGEVIFPSLKNPNTAFYSTTFNRSHPYTEVFEVQVKDSVITPFDVDLTISSTPQWSKDGTTYFIYGSRAEDEYTLEFHFHNVVDSTCVVETFPSNELINKGRRFKWHSGD